MSFGKNDLQIDEITGIATELSNDVTEIGLDVELSNIVDGEFWIALSGSTNPENNSISIRLQSNGLARFYTNNSFYDEKTWDFLREGTLYGSSKPYYYNLTFKITANSVDISINNNFNLKNLSTTPHYLFLGYKNKSAVNPVTVFVNISNLKIK